MDFPELNFIRSDIDPATVKPLDTVELIQFVNQFLLSSTQNLDSFCAKFQERILALELRLNSFERQLILLERKLADIPGQVPIVPASSSPPSLELETNVKSNPVVPESQLKLETVSVGQARPEMGESTSREEKPEEKAVDGVPAKEHPVFGKYFRMLKMGVPEPAVRQKMRAEGVDPAILDMPDKLTPLSAGKKKRQQSSGSETGDDAGELSSSSSSSASFGS